jgi:hypothetical protein
MSFTFSQGLAMLKQSLGFYVGDVNIFLKVSTGLGTAMARLANKFGTNSDKFITGIATSRAAFRNYIADLRTMNKYFKEHGVFPGSGKFKNDSVNESTQTMKKAAAQVISFIDNMFKRTQPKLNIMQRLFSKLKLPEVDAKGFFSAGNIANSVEQVINIFVNFVTTMARIPHTLKLLMPKVLMPINNAFKDFVASFLITTKT